MAAKPPKPNGLKNLNNEKLIEIVRKRPILYDASHPDYKNLIRPKIFSEQFRGHSKEQEVNASIIKMLLNNGSKSEMISPTHDVFCGKLTFLRRKMFKCKECDFRSASRQSWQIHQSAHIEIQPFWFDEYDYIPILKMRFRPLESTKFQARLFKCKYCKFQTQWEGIFNFHTSQHSNFKPRKCQDCKFSTAAKNLLNFHRNIYYFKDSVECNTSDTKYVNVSSTGEQSTFQCCKLISNSPGIALRKCFVKIERMSYFVNRKNIPNKDSNDFNFGETQNVHAKYRDKSQLHVTNEQSNYHQVDH